jgi:hypothetical protein
MVAGRSGKLLAVFRALNNEIPKYNIEWRPAL